MLSSAGGVDHHAKFDCRFSYCDAHVGLKNFWRLRDGAYLIQTCIKCTEKISIKLQLHKQFVNYNYIMLNPTKLSTGRRHLNTYFFHNKMTNDYLAKVISKLTSCTKDQTKAY